eukprot:3679602-Pyramimonas_sp.AAC.1
MLHLPSLPSPPAYPPSLATLSLPTPSRLQHPTLLTWRRLGAVLEGTQGAILGGVVLEGTQGHPGRS